MKKKYNILIVDDRPENLLTLEGILESSQLNIIKARSGNEALGLLLEYNVALVLMDVQMPGMDGFETAEIMRSSERTRHIPIIFVTAISKQRKHVFKGYETGAVDYLYKPLDLEILKSKISAFIELFKYKESLEQTTSKLQETVEQLHDAKIAAEEATKAKSTFLASMSHEIRTPLNGIIGIAELGLMDKNSTPLQSERFLDIKTSGRNLLEIINDILDISKIEAGKFELEETEFSIREMLDKVFKIIDVFARNKDISLVVDMTPQMPDILIGDQLRIRQVLTNLLNNAVKFTEKGFVRLKVELIDLVEEQIRLRFCVEDTGSGIPKEKQALLFEKYTQAEASTSRKYGGTGLGLNIARKLVDLMGGKIEVESEEDKGSKFFFTINLITGDQTFNPGEIEATPPLKYNRVLLVTECEEINETLEKIFAFWKIEMLSATNADEALKKLAGNPFDVIFVNFSRRENKVDNIIDKIESVTAGTGTRLVFLNNQKVNTEIERLKKLEKYNFLNEPVLQRDLKDFFQGITPQSRMSEAVKKAVENRKVKGSSAAQISLPFGDGIEILIVEDQLINRKVITQFLERKEWGVQVVENGKQAVEALRKHPRRFSLVLMLSCVSVNGYDDNS
jgi:signal transduction histidine kinase